MKPGSFSLNPYATSYIPLSKREGYVVDDELLYTQHPTHVAQSQQHHVSHDHGAQGVKSFLSSEQSMLNKSSNTTYKQMSDEDLEMDMDVEFLLMTFPGLSRESIADVYLANSSDVEATIDMLTQLEIYSSEPEKLPDTLDIGDISESGPSTSAVSKTKNAETETIGSSSATLSPPDSS